MAKNDHNAKGIASAKYSVWEGAYHRLYAIAFARWAIFKIISFLEYLLFFERFFVQNNCYVLVEWFFCMFLACLIFNPNSQFCNGYRLCMGYSHCKMAEF